MNGIGRNGSEAICLTEYDSQTRRNGKYFDILVAVKTLLLSIKNKIMLMCVRFHPFLYLCVLITMLTLTNVIYITKTANKELGKHTTIDFKR